MFTTESKSQLAKLLATENVHVEHRKVPTAYFDLKTRTIVCPIWKDMNGALYDLLMGHEVGHALFTPAEGWHSAIKDKHKGNFKSFLNVLEDARIEKKMKRKFPGLILSFREGYRHLRKENFFGIKDRNVNDLALIDRLNLLAKGGDLLESRFTPEEQVYVKRMEDLETWDEVVELATELYAKAKEEATTDKSFANFEDEDEDKDAGDDSDNLFPMPGDGDSDPGDRQNKDDFDEDFKSSMFDDQIDSDDENPSSKTVEPDPTSMTDDHFRQQETKLLSNDSLDLTYVTLPKANLDTVVFSHKETLGTLKKYYSSHSIESIDAILKEFLDRNDTYVSLLAQEFEMKKAATIYKKSKRADTGDLNLNQLYRYKLLDDVIFKKRTKIYKGKSHGIVLLLDKSGSMSPMMQDSIEQILILSMFCRKVNIPFVAYSFHGSNSRRNYNHNVDVWKYREGDLMMNSEFSLREIVNSTVSVGEFRDILKYQLYLSLKYSSYSGGIPHEESLRNTPLNESIVAMDPIITGFRQKHHVDLAHLIIIQDGQSDGNRSIYRDGGYHDTVHTNDMVITDRENHTSYRTENGLYYGLTASLLKWLKYRTGVEIFGLYMVPSGRPRKMQEAMHELTRTKHGGRLTETDFVKAREILKLDRYFESYADGYTRFSFVQSHRGPAEETLDALLPSDKTTTKGRIGTAFAKMFRKKSLNRVMATKFIPLLAAGV